MTAALSAVVDADANIWPPMRPAKIYYVAYDFTSELHANKRVSDVTYARTVAAFGEPGVIDLIGVQGYYTMLAMMMNVARTTLGDADAAEGLARWPE